MYSDRELLELAAKASGLLLCGYSWIGENEDDDECEILEAAFVKNYPEQDVAIMWNPLTDDGDALRLTVVLGLDVTIDNGRSHTWADTHSMPCEALVKELHGNDALAATRRAIVRAAAAIGEAMQ